MSAASSRRFAVGLIAVLAVLALAPIAPAQQQSAEMQAVMAAEQLVQQEKPDEALVELQKIIEANPQFAPAYFVSGLAFAAKQQKDQAFDSMVTAADLQPGWGQAHRLASMYAADMGNLDASWDQAIKAHQAGTDMSDAFAGLQSMTEAPADLDILLSAYRVFVGPFDTTVFEESGDSALQGGSSSSATSRTDVGKRVVQEAANDISGYQQEARRQFANSRSFGLVQRQDQAQLIFVTEVDSLSDNISRRRLRGVVKLVNAQTGEEEYRRRIDFTNIVTRADLNRDFTQLMEIMQEWAAEQQR